MSYKALYRKYRPATFVEILGQDHIVLTLENVIKNDKISHAYLFAGPRGVGKTSVAHVFAKEVNIFKKGKFNPLDVIEMDAASNNGIAEIRQLIDNCRYAPTGSKFKVYIIDEAHMLTKGAFNALLKILEEPPAHVIFILATTEPNKIPITVLSRLQRFSFKRVHSKVIYDQLVKVLNKENIFVEKDALNLIAKLADGGLRDALSIADQTSAYGNNSITFTAISQIFGIVSKDNQIKLLELAYTNKSKELLVLINQFIDGGINLERLVHMLISILRDYIIYYKVEDQELLENLSVEEITKMHISMDFAYKAIDLFAKLLFDLKFSQIPRQTFELSIFKLVQKEESFRENKIIVQSQNNEIDKTNLQEKQVNNNLDKTRSAKENPTILKKESKVKPEPTLDSQPASHITTPKDKDIQPQDTVSTLQDSSWTIDTSLTSEKSVKPKKKNITSDKTKQLDTSDILSDVNSALEDTQELSSEFAQKDSDIAATEEDILTTHEVETSSSKDLDSDSEEIDLVSMFSTQDLQNEKHDNPNSTNSEYPIEEILNLLVQSQKEKAAKIKTKLSLIDTYGIDAKSITYASMFEKTKLIAVGANFILLTSLHENVITQMKKDAKTESFANFVFQVFDEFLQVFIITKEKFETVKKRYSELSAQNKLPDPYVVKLLYDKPTKQTKAEKLGSSLFGNLFKK